MDGWMDGRIVVTVFKYPELKGRRFEGNTERARLLTRSNPAKMTQIVEKTFFGSEWRFLFEQRVALSYRCFCRQSG